MKQTVTVHIFIYILGVVFQELKTEDRRFG
jgi:hypothetical protein